MSLLDDSPTAVTNVAEYTVSEISGALKRTVEERFEHVRVRGEISGYRGPHSSGHAYFCLKDDRARLEAVVWRTAFSKLAFKPQEGLEIVATGKLTTYPGSSKYQIVIEQMEPAGAGALMALLDERRRKLEAEGLFAAERKQVLPFLPRVIGVVTSPTGAVIRDIHHRIADRFPLHLLVWPVRVQGDTCGEEVAAAIAGFDAIEAGGTVPRPDLIIVARGGGSLEDLWGFNDEAVVRAASACSIPLISAVGHETDWTLLDHVADRRAPTPTGAAEMAVPVKADLAAALAALHARNAGAVSRRLEAERRTVAATARALPSADMLLALPRRRLDEAGGTIGRALQVAIARKKGDFAAVAGQLSPVRLEAFVSQRRADLRHAESHARHALTTGLQARRQRFERLAATLQPHMVRARSQEGRHRLDALAAGLDRTFTQSLERHRQALATATRMAASLDPTQVLQRGYAIIRGADDVPITRAGDLTPGLRFEVEFADRERRQAVSLGEAADSETAVPAQKPVRATRRPVRAVSNDQGSLF
ncbi:exodeoxyribonuclease VII large subunit [Mangrovicella endophytica]|uniref:exodeoxyribonuclease VII large subunit n=1 Tax=Mangrovicella endophytica TaxID=2066697 RepID=UPI000C9E3304|nr:exodeoxyribonuclease VII large subunit [Mangrovicella endophytica]